MVHERAGGKIHARQPMSEYARLPCFQLFAASSLPPFLAGRLQRMEIAALIPRVLPCAHAWQS
jgi:hypothetical protein